MGDFGIDWGLESLDWRLPPIAECSWLPIVNFSSISTPQTPINPKIAPPKI
jgi:hypothetical protein